MYAAPAYLIYFTYCPIASPMQCVASVSISAAIVKPTRSQRHILNAAFLPFLIEHIRLKIFAGPGEYPMARISANNEGSFSMGILEDESGE